MTEDDAAGGADVAAERWLRQHRDGAPAVELLAFFDARPAVAAEDLPGRWRGSELPSGSRFDGLLHAHGWYGKEFVDAETVHPLLFRGRGGRPTAIRPGPAPLGLLRTHPRLVAGPAARTAFAVVRPLLRTRRPAARVRMLEHRGVRTAVLIYDRLPVLDVFRRISAGAVLGLMDMRGVDEPYVFLLERALPPHGGPPSGAPRGRLTATS